VGQAKDKGAPCALLFFGVALSKQIHQPAHDVNKNKQIINK
jgi:hypothetical protein